MGVARCQDGTSWSAASAASVAGLAGVYAAGGLRRRRRRRVGRRSMPVARAAAVAAAAAARSSAGAAAPGRPWAASFERPGRRARRATFDDGGSGEAQALYAGWRLPPADGGVAAPGLARWSGTSWSPVVTEEEPGDGAEVVPRAAARRSSLRGARRRRWHRNADDGGGPALWIGGDFYLLSLAAGGVTHAYLVPEVVAGAHLRRRHGAGARLHRARRGCHRSPARRPSSRPSRTARLATTPIPARLAMTASGAAVATTCDVTGSDPAPGTLACTPAAPLPGEARSVSRPRSPIPERRRLGAGGPRRRGAGSHPELHRACRGRHAHQRDARSSTSPTPHPGDDVRHRPRWR